MIRTTFMNNYTPSPRASLAVFVILLLAVVSACGGEDEANRSPVGDPGWYNDDPGPEPSNNGSSQEPPPQEDVQEYRYATPAVIGQSIYIANEILNSIAVIDSETLHIDTIPAGFRPTMVVGPAPDFSDDADAVIMALNEGSNTVTVYHPTHKTTRQLDVLSNANNLIMDDSGRYGIAWYDDTKATHSTAQTGDLAAISFVTADASYQVAVGFHIRDIIFNDANTHALILSDDGVSRLALEAIDNDQFVAPIAYVPESLAALNPQHFQFTMTPDGQYIITRHPNFAGLVLLDINSETHHIVHLAESPSYLALASPGGSPEIVAILRDTNQLIRAEIPSGLIDIAALGNPNDTTIPDDENELDDIIWPENDRFYYQGLSLSGLGAISISGDQQTALVFSTLNDEQRAILYEFESDTQRTLYFEKGIRGILPDEKGQAFVVFHTKTPGTIPSDMPMTDPDYIARSWGLSIVDIESGATRLILTQHEPDKTSLWNPDDDDARLYFIFKQPENGSTSNATLRDLTTVNLRSFRSDSYRLPSPPDILGPISSAQKIYISQRHPQGRMTFIDIDTSERQTITGYQLNAGID